MAGIVDDLPVQPCRAQHPVVRARAANAAAPEFHSGHTDGQVYNGIPLCFFSYGGGVVRTAPFDVLVMMPPGTPY
jgi:hypothetical protein